MIPARSRILDVGVRSIFHTLLLFSLFLLFRGHNQPGGGFAGGLVAGAAFVLLWTARGSDSLRMLRVDPETLLGAGLLLAVATGLGALVAGEPFLDGGRLTLHPPLFDDVKIYSVLAFDSGVYLVVLGFVTLALRRLGSDGEAASR